MSVLLLDASTPSFQRRPINNYPYGSSIASSASSSSSSVFSVDGVSSQSSNPSSSTTSLDVVWGSENVGQVPYSSSQPTTIYTSESSTSTTFKCPTALAPQPEFSLPAEQRQNPRRTQPAAQLDSQNGTSSAPCPRPPPSLVRQNDRKDNFVDGLVDTSTQMIEIIWPLSVLSCSRDAVLGGKNIIGLRTFVQEVLKRSKSSYSTLQVALYYLVLIKPFIPRNDFTMEQPEDSQKSRAMQCGRRMFLAALILASKYLQDRNYSARAWSKISGLKTAEINANEMAFLSAVNWKLHIPEPVFQRWTDVVLKYSPSAHSPKLSPNAPIAWKTVVPHLTPELDKLDFGLATIHNLGYNSPSPSPPPMSSRSPTPPSTSNEPTPTNTYTIPRVLEPTPRDSQFDLPNLPTLPRMGPLPTPQMTPQASSFCTPAVSATNFCGGKSAMGMAMAQIQNASMARITLDHWRTIHPETSPACTRRSSAAPSVSSLSSPESMVSDVSSRSSRSSSISSIASSTCALQQPRLAVQATRRCANMQLSSIKENCRPLIVRTPSDGEPRWDALTSSPEIYSGSGCDYSSVQRTKHCPQVHMNSYTDIADQEAAEGLRDLALNRQSQTQSLACQNRGRKRERPSSTDFSLQQDVRNMIAPRCSNGLTSQSQTRNGEYGIVGNVIPDTKIADSFLLSQNFKLPNLNDVRPELVASNKDGLARKRPCCCKRETQRTETSLPTARGPGMWAGVL